MVLSFSIDDDRHYRIEDATFIPNEGDGIVFRGAGFPEWMKGHFNVKKRIVQYYWEDDAPSPQMLIVLEEVGTATRGT